MSQSQEFIDLIPKPENVPADREAAVSYMQDTGVRLMRAISQTLDPESMMYTASMGTAVLLTRQLMMEARDTKQVVTGGHVETEEEVNHRGHREAGKSSLIDDQMKEATSFLTRD